MDPNIIKSCNAYLLQLAFKGARTYLHSTDIHEALLDLAHNRFSPNAYVASLTIRHQVSTRVWAHFEPHEKAFGSFKIREGETLYSGWLVEDGVPVTSRYDYGEESIIRNAIIIRGKARLANAISSFTPFEQVVGLMRLVSMQNGPSSWMICCVDLLTPLTNDMDIEVCMKRNMQNAFMSMQIFQNGVLSGTVKGVCVNSPIKTPEVPVAKV